MIQMIAPGDAVVPKQNTGGGGSFKSTGVGRKQVLAKRKAEAAASNFGTQKSAAKRENYVLRTINGVPTRLPANFANLPAAAQEYILRRGCDDSLMRVTSKNAESMDWGLSSVFGSSLSSVFQKKSSVTTMDWLIISVKEESKLNIPSHSVGDSSRPISIYAIHREDNWILSSAGIKFNVEDFTLDVSFGLDNIGISGNLRNGDTSQKVGLVLNVSELRVGVEWGQIVQLKNGQSVVNTTNISGNVGLLAALALSLYGYSGSLQFPQPTY